MRVITSIFKLRCAVLGWVVTFPLKLFPRGRAQDLLLSQQLNNASWFGTDESTGLDIWRRSRYLINTGQPREGQSTTKEVWSNLRYGISRTSCATVRSKTDALLPCWHRLMSPASTSIASLARCTKSRARYGTKSQSRSSAR